jgi:hypothetical protein
MRDISRRIKNVEKRLVLNEKPITITIVQFGGQLPPDWTVGNTTYHLVHYDEIKKK